MIASVDGFTLDWLYSRQDLGIAPGLDRIEELLRRLGDPHLRFHSVHVAGTNGKGSVAAILAEALRLSGLSTGLYTSPHLIRFSERIRIDSKPISTGDLSQLIEATRPIVEIMDRADASPTFFEIVTGAAFVHFAESGVDWAVIETGMGGAGDATNVVSPEVTIITNVTRDHTTFLGEDLASVAAEKAGIVKPGVPLITGASGKPLDVLSSVCSDRGAPIVVVGEDYQVDHAGNDVHLSRNGVEQVYRVGMRGDHQLDNAALVVAAADQIREAGFDLKPDALREALATTVVPGRLEVFLQDDVTLTIDGAHNVAAASAIARELGGQRAVFDLIVGFNRDKEWREMLAQLILLARRVWGVPVRSTRSLDPLLIAEALPSDLPFAVASNFEDAHRRARHSGAQEILVTGSLFLAGEARAVLTGDDLTEVGGSQ